MSDIDSTPPAQTPLTDAALALPQHERLATSLTKSRLFPGLANAEGALAVILAGAELGVGPIAALTSIHLIKGRITLSASLMAAAIRRSAAYDYRVTEHTATACEIEFTRHGRAIGSSRFTWQDATVAGLTSSDTWRKFPRNMLFARAMSNGARWHCPDVFSGAPVYTEDELDETPATTPGTFGDLVDVQWEMAAPAPTAPAPAAVGPTLDELVTRYGADAVFAAAGGIPATDEEVAAVAAQLAAQAQSQATQEPAADARA